jgi:putative DNA primase/helicase
MNVEPFGGFEDWSEQVREGLVWLGEADPVDTVQLVQDTDPETEALEEVVDYWKNQLGVGVGYKTHEILACATNIPDFYSALINAAGYRGNIDARRLGDWLRYRQGRVVSSGLKIVGKQGSMGQRVWVLQKA